MLSRAMEEFPEGAQFSTDISDFEGSSETIFSSWTLQHIINNNELKITFMKLLTLSDAKNIFLYEKTSDQAHNDKDAEGVVYQRIRSVSEYLDIFEELGFTKKSIYSIAIRQYGPFRKIFDNPETRIRFVPFWFLFKIDVIISKLKLFIRNGLIYEQDSAILFIKNDY
jgi:hypothetical protein